jgi:hypothetical protein
MPHRARDPRITSRMAQHEIRSSSDPECQAVFKYAEDTRCVLSYERTFFRPVFE